MHGVSVFDVNVGIPHDATLCPHWLLFDEIHRSPAQTYGENYVDTCNRLTPLLSLSDAESKFAALSDPPWSYEIEGQKLVKNAFRYSSYWFVNKASNRFHGDFGSTQMAWIIALAGGHFASPVVVDPFVVDDCNTIDDLSPPMKSIKMSRDDVDVVDDDGKGNGVIVTSVAPNEPPKTEKGSKGESAMIRFNGDNMTEIMQLQSKYGAFDHLRRSVVDNDRKDGNIVIFEIPESHCHSLSLIRDAIHIMCDIFCAPSVDERGYEDDDYEADERVHEDDDHEADERVQ